MNCATVANGLPVMDDCGSNETITHCVIVYTIVQTMSATNSDQHNLVEQNFIHDSTHDALGAQRAIHAQTGDATGSTLYGIVGLNIRNNIVANAALGIQVSGSTSPNQPADQAFVFNNTVYNCSPNADLAVNTNVTNSVVKNNFVFAGKQRSSTNSKRVNVSGAN